MTSRAGQPPSTPIGFVLLAVGIAALLGGVGLVISAELLSHSVAAFNQSCTGIPGCHREAGPGVGWYVSGFGLIVVGAVLVALGYRRGLVRRA